jgi:hypothetical protein
MARDHGRPKEVGQGHRKAAEFERGVDASVIQAAECFSPTHLRRQRAAAGGSVRRPWSSALSSALISI